MRFFLGSARYAILIQDAHAWFSGDAVTTARAQMLEPRIDPRAERPDTEESAQAAGLRYVTDAKPGIRRIRCGKGFRYTAPGGNTIHDEDTLRRIRSLVIPPAWTGVWICTIPNGHLQATGRDARGRKQSRYHPRWREVRDETKYERMVQFAQALPTIRECVKEDLAVPSPPRQKVLAAIVSLMEQTHILFGNKHVEIKGSQVTFSFQGKSRIHHTVSLQDRRLARVIKHCEELPGYELFQYVDEHGERHAIDSSDVNEYLREITGQHFTAKDFRTWAGSVLASDLLRGMGAFENATQGKKNVIAAIKAVALKLGNTPAVCKKCYIHPAVLEAYLGGITVDEAKAELKEEIGEQAGMLREEEHVLLRLLEQRTVLGKVA